MECGLFKVLIFCCSLRMFRHVSLTRVYACVLLICCVASSPYVHQHIFPVKFHLLMN